MNVTPVLELLSTTVRALSAPRADTPVVLQDFVAGAADVFGADDAGVLIRGADGKPHTVVTTGTQARLTEHFQVRTGIGPCIASFTTHHPARVGSADEAARRWPGWSVGHGSYESVMGVPFTYDGDGVGSLNLFADRRDAFDQEALEGASSLADVITIVLLYGQRTASAEILAGQLQVALDTRVVIEQAKGIVAERLGIPPKESWERLRRMARSSNSSLQDVSQAVIDGLTPPR